MAADINEAYRQEIRGKLHFSTDFSFMSFLC